MSRLETILWLDKEIDRINEEAVKIGEMLLEETDIDLIKILDERLRSLEEKMSYLQQKISFEKRQFTND